MNKKIIAIGILGMFLLTSITAMSAVVQEESVPVQVYGEQTTGTGRIYGYVTTLLLKPIEGAKITIEDDFYGEYNNETTTGSDGYYEFTDVPLERTYSIFVSAKGYRDGYKYCHPSIWYPEIQIDFKLIKKIINQQSTTTTTTTTIISTTISGQSIPSGQQSTDLFLQTLEQLQQNIR